jgi:phosphatidylserine/phosphatidylglycerophosphate/cardiolipin synthase-like enzyme
MLALQLFLLAGCALTPKPEPCPPGTQELPSCPPLSAVNDPFINEVYEKRTWVPPKELGVDPIELGKTAEIPVQMARTKFLGPNDHAAIDSLAAKIWMIENAEHTIDFTYYIFKTDLIGYSILGAMCEAVQRGVDVRVTVDALGSFNTTHPALKALETCAEDAGFMRNEAGELTTRKARVQVVIFNALTKPTNPNRRSHDKLLVKDGSFPDKSVAITGGRNISEDYYGILADGTADPDPFRDAELIVRSEIGDDDLSPTVGEVSELYATVLFLIHKNKRIRPGRSHGEAMKYREERIKSREALQTLKAYDYFKPHLEEMPKFMTTGFHRSQVRLAHELGNLTDRKVTRDVAGNLQRNPNSIMSVLAELSELRPGAKSVRIVSPYLFLAKYKNKDNELVTDEAEEIRQWLSDHPSATLEIVTNSVLTSDNFPAQSVIDMDMAPRLLFTPEQRKAWMEVAGPDEAESELVNSPEWADLVRHPRLKIYETGKLDSVLLGNGTQNYGKLHAKYYLEGDLGFVGTTNFDYRSRLYNNEMGFFFLDPELAAELNGAFDHLVDSSYRWGSPEWFEMRKAVMGLKGMKGRSTRKQSRYYKMFKKTGFIWYL